MFTGFRDIPVNASRSLDYLRCISAIAVVIGHAFQIFVLPTLGVGQMRWATLFSNLAWFSVSVFFALSGLMVYGVIAKNVQNNQGRFEARSYAASRLLRLFPPLLFSLVMTVALYALAIWIDPTVQETIRLQGDGRLARESLGLDSMELACNGLFLQGLLCEPLSLNGPLWSLSYEFWYYYFALAVAVVYVNKRVRAVPLVVFFFVLIASSKDPQKFFYGWAVWFSGFLIGFGYHNHKAARVTQLLLVSWLMFIVACIAIDWHCGGGQKSIGYYVRVLLALAFPSVICAIVYRDLWLPAIMPFSFAYRGARFSYTLYLVHYPIMLFAFVMLHKYTLSDPLRSILVGAGFVAFAIIFAHYVSLFVENRRLLTRLLRRLGISIA